jgi:hypothetical protein
MPCNNILATSVRAQPSPLRLFQKCETPSLLLSRRLAVRFAYSIRRMQHSGMRCSAVEVLQLRHPHTPPHPQRSRRRAACLLRFALCPQRGIVRGLHFSGLSRAQGSAAGAGVGDALPDQPSSCGQSPVTVLPAAPSAPTALWPLAGSGLGPGSGTSSLGGAADAGVVLRVAGS